MTDALKVAREFPIQLSYRKVEAAHPLRIPWKIAELAYSVYASRYGSSQSLETLASRGGFHPSEMDELLPDWRERCDETKELRERLKEAEAVINYYADSSQWFCGGSGHGHADDMTDEDFARLCRQDTWHVDEDGYDRAREYRAKYPASEPEK